MKLKIQKRPDYVLGIDPGNEETAVVVLNLDKMKPTDFMKIPNSEVRGYVSVHTGTFFGSTFVAMEDIVNYGGSVGRTVFETVEWIGRLKEFMELSKIPYETLHRKTIIAEVTGNPKGNDSHVREEMIHLYGKPGTKKKPGPTYGMKADMWSALGIATAYAARKKWISI